MTRRFSRLLPIIGVVILLAFSSMAASAAVTTSNDTAYNGTQTDADQAIEVTYTVSPEGSTINNMTVAFTGTNRALLEPNSFSFAVRPGGADINVESRPGNAFFIEEIEPDEEVTFVFQTYPKTIKQEQIDAANVRMEYIQNGQELTDSETVSADMRSSPWFELQQANEEVDQLQSQLGDVSLAGQFTNAAFLGGLAIGIVGLAFGAYSWRRRSSSASDLKREHANHLERLAGGMESRDDTKTLNNAAEQIREEIDSDDGDDW
ncbi:hypothetical protein [Halobellus clavatus]|jgi:hypothetical protein|uniref:Uncharacterized protein n=1 Tax=Halobellus clavatus TaxID=660517 RepID=A0A1H3HV69_9EURY|nr:hypothetical protein [Halobellus clavatus]SDY18609.1 hypothetical protein SAMN04487946_10840 [Halobellus clavatus]